MAQEHIDQRGLDRAHTRIRNAALQQVRILTNKISITALNATDAERIAWRDVRLQAQAMEKYLKGK